MRFHIEKIIMLLAFVLVTVAAPSAQAGSHDALTPLLIDLSGWQGDEAEGMSMDMGAMKMITATRTYENGGKELGVNIMISRGDQGSMGMGMEQGQMQTMNMETGDAKMRIEEIDGYHVQTVYEKKENKGSVVVYLAKGEGVAGYFSLSYEGLGEDEAMALAKKFDWAKMKKAVEELL